MQDGRYDCRNMIKSGKAVVFVKSTCPRKNMVCGHMIVTKVQCGFCFDYKPKRGRKPKKK